ncbi:MAG: hypothetical protein ACPG4Z_04300 [Chitinophagales bacterium]
MMNYMRLFVFTCMLLSFVGAKAQGTYSPLGENTYRIVDRMDIKYGKILSIPHTSVKPYNRTRLGAYAEELYNSNIELSRGDQFNLEYLLHDNTEWTDSFAYERKAFAKIFYPEESSMFAVNTNAFQLRLNPVAHINFANEFGDKTFFTNMQGLEMRASIKKKLSFYMYMGTNRMRFPSFVRDERINREYQNVPGDGYYKEYKDEGQDYFTARGYMTFNVLDHVDFQFGYDKQFIGNGYRSLFLSDNANAFLFLKMNINVWRINYQSIFAELTGQYIRGGDRLLDKKYGAFHHLNFNVTHWLDFGVFEGVMLNRSNHFELHYLNPLIFYRSVEQDLGSPDNSVIGFDYKANFLNSFSFYGQLLLDEFNFTHIRARDGWWANKYGLQFGLKYIDVAGINNLDAQIEYNVVRPFTYTHNSDSAHQLSNYTHYNQALAHPLGANFREFIFVANYQPIPALQLQLEYINSVKGLDTIGTLNGGDIFQQSNGNLASNEFDNFIGQGVAYRVNYLHLLASYQFWHNMHADLDFGLRTVNSDIDAQDRTDFWIGAGLRFNVPYRKYNY